jgi:hypothetical protein
MRYMSGLRRICRVLASVGAASGAALLMAACSSSGHVASEVNSAAASAGAAASQRTAASGAPAISTSPPTTSNASSSSTSASPTCAQFAANTFLRISTATAAADGSLVLTGNPATVVCGGPDDLHYSYAANVVTAHVLPSAAITIFDLPDMSRKPIGHTNLSAYLASDDGTRTFLVTGPLSAISGLQEEYHP